VSPFKFEPESGAVPIGQHDVKIVDAVHGTNSKGNPNLRVVFETPDGAQIADWLVHLPQSRWRWRQLWEAAGLEFPNGGEVDERDLIGRCVHIDVIEDTYQGRTRARVGEISEYLGPDIPVDLKEPQAAARSQRGSFAQAAGIEDDEEASF
jgi:hypothetical protein